ncbi:MAG: orotate phosphoribosyltransferase [Oscillospiraceae bacterium]|nr:orotate phosphoribosyltransferase [Oscillospiraceae bacterium]
MPYQEKFISLMVRAGVLLFGDFVTKSGRNTPYFINTGNYKDGAQITELGDYYAACIQESGVSFDALFGPAYKGIPLAVAAASSLYRTTGRSVPYCFNRKESKDHGEGGMLIGYPPKAGDRLAIIEDVVTAGTAVRETISLFQSIVPVQFAALYVSVDRMERGKGSKSALAELQDEYGIPVYSLVTVRDIITYLHNRPIDGMIYLDDTAREKMERYLQQYGE